MAVVEPATIIERRLHVQHTDVPGRTWHLATQAESAYR